MKWTEDDEKQAGKLVPGEVYPFEIVEAEETVTTKGNPCINLKLLVFVEDVQRTLYDKLMPQLPEKLRSFCECFGLMEQYKSRSVSAVDCGAGEGWIRLSKKKWNDRVQVEAYLGRDPRGGGKPEPEKQKLAGTTRPNNYKSTEDDGIPF